MAASPLLARFGLRVALAGSSASLALALSTAVDAAARIGFYADTTGAAEKLHAVVGGITGFEIGVSGSVLQLSVAADADSTHTLGRSRFGSPTTDEATWAHYDRLAATTYALKQDASGATYLNAASGQLVRLRVNNATIFSIAAAAATFSAGVVTTFSDTTSSTSTSTGAIVCSGGAGFAGQVTATAIVTASAGAISSAGRVTSFGTITTQLGTGSVGFWRSGGTIGTAGDMVFQTDLAVATGAFVFRSGQTTPVTVATIAVTGAISAGPDTDIAHTLGRAYIGYNGATSDRACFTHVDRPLQGFWISEAGNCAIDAATGGTVILRVNAVTQITMSATALTVASTIATSTFSATTASSSTTTGAVVISGGLGVAGQLTVGGGSWTSGGTLTATSSVCVSSGLAAFAGSGSVRIYRVAGTIGTAGDLCLQSDAVGTRDFLFAAGAATAVVAKILGANGGYQVGANQVVGPRITGWTAWTGTPTRTAVATGAATATNCAEAIKALIDDLITHGLIGA
jgi:hypothetical protein